MGERRRIRTRDVCALLGITPPTIRLYEQYNQARRYGFADNGYRDFTYQSVAQLASFRDLSVMGMGLDDAARVSCDATCASLGEALADCREGIDAKIARLERLREVVDEQRKLVGLIETGLDDYRVDTMPAMYLLACEEDGAMPASRSHVDLIRAWGEQAPFVRFMAYFDEVPSHYSVARIGLAVDEAHADLVELDSPHVMKVGGRPCACGLCRVSNVLGRESSGPADGFDSYYCSVAELLAWMGERGLRPAGGAYGRLVASHVADADGPDNDYYYGWVPVEP